MHMSAVAPASGCWHHSESMSRITLTCSSASAALLASTASACLSSSKIMVQKKDWIGRNSGMHLPHSHIARDVDMSYI